MNEYENLRSVFEMQGLKDSIITGNGELETVNGERKRRNAERGRKPLTVDR